MEKIYDFIGVGMGPSNLSFSIAVAEYNNSDIENKIDGLFFESKDEFVWHSDMLLPGATMQIHFLKDLVTLRNPSSEYSFLSYLKDVNRLTSFINQKDLYPTRVEYNGYYSWVAKKFENATCYGSNVEKVVPIYEQGRCKLLRVYYRKSGVLESVLSRSLVVAQGLTPNIPDELSLNNKRVFHSSRFLSGIKSIPGGVRSALVVGAGQSSTEIVNYLYDNYKEARITNVFSKYSLTPADDSAFVNEIFNNENVDMFFNLKPNMKNQLLEELKPTNYSAVDIDLIEELNKKIYQDSLHDIRRVEFKNKSRVLSVEESKSGVSAKIENCISECEEVYEYDVIILATGYKPRGTLSMFAPLKKHIVRTVDGSLIFSRVFEVLTDDNFDPVISIQGASEETHGITNTLLSTLPYRSQEMLNNLVRNLKNNEYVHHEEYEKTA